MRIASKEGREVHVLPYTDGSSFVMTTFEKRDDSPDEVSVRVDRDEAIRMAGILIAHALGFNERTDIDRTVGYIESITRGLSR